jgi:hypothetical protein
MWDCPESLSFLFLSYILSKKASTFVDFIMLVWYNEHNRQRGNLPQIDRRKPP